MQVEKTNNISFQSFGVDAKGRQALNRLACGTPYEAMSAMTKMLTDFKTQMDEFVTILDKSPKTKGVDIVLTSHDAIVAEHSADKICWANVPMLMLKKGNKVMFKTESANLWGLHFDNEATSGEKLDIANIQHHSRRLILESQEWFDKNLKKIIGTPGIKQESKNEILKNIFG